MQNGNTIILLTWIIAHRDLQLNAQSWVEISISFENKRILAEVTVCQILNYASDGGSRRQEGDKYNLHVFLTSGETERHPQSAGLWAITIRDAK